MIGREDWREQKLAGAAAVARRYAERDDVAAVLLIGSVSAGLGTERSDVDLLVVAAGEREADVRQHHVDGTRVDAELRSHAWLRELVQACTRFTATTRDLEPLLRPPRELELAVRIAVGSTVAADDDAGTLVAALREGTDVLRRLVIGRRVMICLGKLEDCLGALAEDDGDAAAIVSHELALFALEAFLAGCGDLFLGHKWVPQKLRRSGGAAFPYADAMRLLQRPPHEDAAASSHARIRLAQACFAAAMTAGWDVPGAAAWRHWRWDAAGVRRGVEWLPLRLGDAIVLLNAESRQLKVSERALAAWGRCNGAGEDADVLARLAEVGAVEGWAAA